MFDALRNGLEDAWASAAAFTPKLVAALVILLVGALVARIVRTVATRLLTTMKVDQHLDRVLSKTGLPTGRVAPTPLLATVLWGLIMVVTVQAVAETLGATALAAALAGLIAYLPLVLVAAAILIGTVMLADWAGDLVRDTAGDNGRMASNVTRIAILAFGTFVALGQLRVAPAIVNGLFYALVGTAAVAATIAFGVGGIPVARDVIRERVDGRRTAAGLPRTGADAAGTTRQTPPVRVPDIHGTTTTP